MNKKGFAISIILYSMVFLLITILFVILSILKARYTVSNNLRTDILKDFNEKDFGDVIFTKRITQLQSGKCKWIDDMDTPSNGEDDVIYVTSCFRSSLNAPDINDSVNNNYVWYSGKLWRIVAIYPDRTMKLITEDTITSVPWGQSPYFEGSWIYQWLNEDFLDTLYNADDIIENTVWNYTPDNGDIPSRPESLPNQKTVTAKVGLLTAYEYYHSHYHEKTGNTTRIYAPTYLDYKNGTTNPFDYWWFITPHSGIRCHYKNYDDPSESSKHILDYMYETAQVRPVIKLKYGVKFTGSGTKANPYKIVGDKTSPIYNTTLLNTRSSGEYVSFDGLTYRIVEVENGTTRLVLNRAIPIDRNAGYVGSQISNTLVWGKSTNYAYSQNNPNQVYADYFFNNTWYNSISTTYKNMMTDGTFYMGSSNDITNYKKLVCKDANPNEVTIKNCTRYTIEDTDKVFVGKVGLPRLGQMFSSDIMWTGSDHEIWLFHIKGITLQYTGLTTTRSGTYQFGVYRPSITIKSSVKITGGAGTSDSPFQISE